MDRRTASLTTTLACFALLLAGTAHAQLIGNPKPAYDDGTVFAGAAYSQMERSVETTLSFTTTGAVSTSFSGTEPEDFDFARAAVYVGVAVAEGMTLAATVGTLTIEDAEGGEVDGAEFGILLRVQGATAAVRTASVDNEFWEGDATQIDLGYGLGTPVAEGTTLYGGFLLSIVSAELDATQRNLDESSAELSALFGPTTVTSASLELEEDDTLGAFLGVEFAASPALRFDAEVHVLHQQGLALGLEAAF